MAEDDLSDLDALYAAKLQDFTPLRAKLAVAAKVNYNTKTQTVEIENFGNGERKFAA